MTQRIKQFKDCLFNEKHYKHKSVFFLKRKIIDENVTLGM
jgi:hypothetical protein